MSTGLRAVLGGIGFIIGTPRVWPYALVPMAFLIVIAGTLSCFGIWGSARLTDALVGAPENTWGQVGSWTLTTFLALVVLFVAFFVALLLAQPLAGFALEAIVRVQEQRLTGTPPNHLAFFPSMLMSAKIALVTCIIGVPVFVLLTVIGLFFPPAIVVTEPLRLFCGAWLLAWNFLDYPLTLHGLGVRSRIGWMFRNFGAFTTFGLAWALLLLVPGIFLLVLPMGVAGAAQLVFLRENPSEVEGDM